MIWAQLIAQYGLPFAIELMQIIQAKGDPTLADLQALKAKYGTKTADQYLTEAGGPPPATPTVVPSQSGSSTPPAP